MTNDILNEIRSGSRRALAKAITLIESNREDHRHKAEELLTGLHSLRNPTLRIGISGSPGVGKSTFIESLGSHFIRQGHNVAVLAVDPTSPLTQGSILADKTRMPTLATSNHAFIRPTPSAGTLGGVAARTREIITLCEAAGFDVIFIETVGVGQSEISVSHLADLVLLLLPPAGGDALQGIKKGIVEIADMILVNKCDGDLRQRGKEAVSHYQHAIDLVPKSHPSDLWTPPVMAISALEKMGLKEIWDLIQKYKSLMQKTGNWEVRRKKQSLMWAKDTMREEVWRCFSKKNEDAISNLLTSLNHEDRLPLKEVHDFVKKRT